MTEKDIAAVLKSLDAIKAHLEEGDPAEEIADALRAWCTKALKKKSALVLFAY
jgi:hypothetical protein